MVRILQLYAKAPFLSETPSLSQPLISPHPSCRVSAGMQIPCPKGTYCQAGVSLPCPAGTFGSLPGLSLPACSGPCPAGRYCPPGTSSDDDEEAGIPCPAGRYGVKGMGDAACTGPCEAGYYCPAGSVSGVPCGSEYYCPEGSAVSTSVATGWFGTGGGESTRSGQVECMAATGGGGFTPPSGISIVERCPDNTMGFDGAALN